MSLTGGDYKPAKGHAWFQQDEENHQDSLLFTLPSELLLLIFSEFDQVTKFIVSRVCHAFQRPFEAQCASHASQFEALEPSLSDQHGDLHTSLNFLEEPNL